MQRRVPRSILFGLVCLGLAYFLWQKVRIGIFINITLTQAIFIFGAIAFVIYLTLDHFLNRRR